MRSIMNKHGIMVKFLLTVILAIIIFAPACLLTSKFFRLSQQGKTNFNDLYKTLQDFAKKGEQGKFTGFTLILDENTYVTKFDAGIDYRVYDVPDIVFLYPKAECKDKDCLVLCRETDDLGKKVGDMFVNHRFHCKNILAKPLSDDLKVSSFLALRGIIPGHSGPESRRAFLTLYKDDLTPVIHVVPLGQMPSKKLIDLAVQQLDLKAAKNNEGTFSLSLDSKENLFVDILYYVDNVGETVPPGTEVKGKFFVNKNPALTSSNLRDAYPKVIFGSHSEVYAEYNLISPRSWIFVTAKKPTGEVILQPYYFMEFIKDDEEGEEGIVLLTKTSSGHLQQEEWYFNEEGNIDSLKLVDSDGILAFVEFNLGKRQRHSVINTIQKQMTVKDYATNQEELFSETSPEYQQILARFNVELIEQLRTEKADFNPPSQEEVLSKSKENFQSRVYPLMLGNKYTSYVMLNKKICNCNALIECICNICLKVEARSAAGMALEEKDMHNNEQCVSAVITS